MLKVIVSVFLFLCFSCTLLGQTSEELRKKQADIQREIDELKQSLNDTKKNKKAGLGQLAMIQKKLRLRQQAIGNINEQINVIQGTIGVSRNEISRLKKELDTLKQQYERSVVYAYKNRSNYDFLNFIFSASNFNDALKRIEYLKSYRAYREQQAANIRSTQSLLQQKISGLELSRREKDEVLHKQEKERVVLVEEKKEQDDIVNKLKLREKELSKELAAKAKADKKLRDGIVAAIRREAEKARLEARRKEEALAKERAAKEKAAAAAGNNSNTPADKPVVTVTKPATTAPARNKSVFEESPEGEISSDNFERNKGKLPWPLEKGNIKIHFGVYSIPGISIKGNNPGLTFETGEGAPVKAVFDGDVITVFDVDGSAAVLIQHGKYFTSYGNLASASVSKGQKVKAGQLVGYAGKNDDGNGELEFILMQDTRNIDPESWIRRR